MKVGVDDFLAAGGDLEDLRRQATACDLHAEPREQQLTGRHFVDHGIQPVHQQEFSIGRAACHPDGGVGRDPCRICHHGCQGNGRLLEGGREAGSAAMDADIGLVIEMSPHNPVS